jgi:hypothetical protein
MCYFLFLGIVVIVLVALLSGSSLSFDTTIIKSIQPDMYCTSTKDIYLYSLHNNVPTCLMRRRLKIRWNGVAFFGRLHLIHRIPTPTTLEPRAFRNFLLPWTVGYKDLYLRIFKCSLLVSSRDSFSFSSTGWAIFAHLRNPHFRRGLPLLLLQRYLIRPPAPPGSSPGFGGSNPGFNRW